MVLRGGGGVGDVYDDADAKKTEDTEDSKEDLKTSTTGSLHIQSMQWGLVPHWMKRQPDHVTALKTINARDDTIMYVLPWLAVEKWTEPLSCDIREGGSMWKSIRGRKRCIVLAEGFYEWLKKGTNDRVPHHVKRADGKIMCMAGLWDSVT